MQICTLTNKYSDDNCDATFQDLSEWYKTMIEKYGWVLLSSKKNPQSTKIVAYLHSLDKLYGKLRCYRKKTIDLNKKDDLYVMEKNIYLLFGDFIKKNYKDKYGYNKK